MSVYISCSQATLIQSISVELVGAIFWVCWLSWQHALHHDICCPFLIALPSTMIAMPLLLQVLEKHNDKDAFCIYNDPLLQLFVSVLFLAGIVGAFIGSFTARRFGRKPTMILGGGFFLAGAVLLAPAVHVAMLILGRFCMGIGKRKIMALPGRILILRSVWQKQFLLSCSSVHVTACCNLHFFTSWVGQVLDKGFDNCHLPHSSTAPNGSAPTAAEGPSHSSTKQQCAQYQTVCYSK
jgi:hypothetical protein